MYNLHKSIAKADMLIRIHVNYKTIHDVGTAHCS